MTPALVVVLLALALAVFVVKPFFRSEQELLSRHASDKEARKLRALDAIVDLEADLAAGKLSETDFETFKDDYAREALTAMRELDVAARRTEDADLEAEIAAARARLR